jgi:hypothetical protein
MGREAATPGIRLESPLRCFAGLSIRCFARLTLAGSVALICDRCGLPRVSQLSVRIDLAAA